MTKLLPILRNFIAFITQAISKVSKPEPQINDADVSLLKFFLKNGDCLITRTDYELSNFCEKLLTGSFYGHAAIYLNGWVYEATTTGVRRVSLEKFAFSKDGIALCRLQGPDWTKEQIDKMEQFCFAQLGKPYDYSIDWGSTISWFCSKLVYFAFQKGQAKDLSAIETTETLGLMEITPQNLFNSLFTVACLGVAK
jgi:uncharacterized protein YycO